MLRWYAIEKTSIHEGGRCGDGRKLVFRRYVSSHSYGILYTSINRSYWAVSPARNLVLSLSFYSKLRGERARAHLLKSAGEFVNERGIERAVLGGHEPEEREELCGVEVALRGATSRQQTLNNALPTDGSWCAKHLSRPNAAVEFFVHSVYV